MASGYSTRQPRTRQRKQQKWEKQKIMGAGVGCSSCFSSAEAQGVRRMLVVQAAEREVQQIHGQWKEFKCSFLSHGS